MGSSTASATAHDVTITADIFVGNFPEFGNTARFPPTQISFWLNQAYAQLDACRWDTALDYGAQLFAAHNLVLSDRAAQAAAKDASIGDAANPVQTKTVGGVTVTFDTTAGSIEGAGQWNATSYGQRFYALMRGISAGPQLILGRPVPTGQLGFAVRRRGPGW